MDFNSLSRMTPRPCPIPFPWPELQWDEIRPQVQCPLVPTTPGFFWSEAGQETLQLEGHIPIQTGNDLLCGDVKLKLLLLVISGNYSITNFLIWHVRILYDKQYWKSHRIPRKISTRKWLSSDIPSNPYIFHVLSLNFTTKGEVQWKICWNQPYDTRIIDVAAATPKK